MSLDLQVIFDNPIPVRRFISAVKQVLEEVLPVLADKTLPIRVNSWGKPPPLSVCDLLIDAGWSGLLYYHDAHPVELTVLRIADAIREYSQTDPLEPSDYELTADFTVRASGDDPFRWIFGAVCAAALARETSRHVTLASIGWPGPHEQDPDDFLKRIQASKEMMKAVESII